MTTEKCGQEAAPANPSAVQENKKERPTNGTSGPLFATSSPSADLQRSLENRLHQNLDVSGSPEYALKWKTWDMLSGPPICALRASARRTSGKDFGGWPTPTALDRPRSPETMAKSAAFRKRNANQNTVPLYLGEVAQMSGWPTPLEDDSSNVMRTSGFLSLTHPSVWPINAGWATPTSNDAKGVSTRTAGAGTTRKFSNFLVRRKPHPLRRRKSEAH